jgi:protein-tyrosine phosphatase
MDSSLAFARAAEQSGVSTIVATPHLRADFPDVHVGEIAERCQELREGLERESIAIELISGAEVSLVWALEASDDDLRLASLGQRGTDLLIETPFASVAGLGALLYRIRTQGFRVTLAHPERNADFQSDPGKLTELVRQGLLLQVNASSLLGSGGNARLHRFAERLCREGLAHAIASDAHRATSWRPVTDLSSAAEAAAALVGVDRARWLTCDAPAAIIAGIELPEAPIVRTRSLIRRTFRRW